VSRLLSAIRRLEAQKACLDWAAAALAPVAGAVFELGLGNGRTFDHLRTILPERDIFVFEAEVNAHPDCIPDAEHLLLGDLRDTLPAAATRFAGRVALVHSDIGTGDPARNAAFARWLGPALIPVLAPGAVVASDQELAALAGMAVRLPEGVEPGRYFLYRAGTAV
jgi:hypothetical protein